MHQSADGKVGHHQSIELLTYQIGGLAAQHDVSTAQMSLEFVKRGFYLPSLVIESRQLPGWGLAGIEDGGC